MKEKSERTVADRRSFLKLAGLGTIAGGAACAVGTAPLAAREELSEDGKLYRETEHIKTYYELARF